MALLNGKHVPDEAIDPAKHKFIGRFRPATNWMDGVNTDVLCACGEILKYRHQGKEHYDAGCCDVNQYVDIAEESK